MSLEPAVAWLEAQGYSASVAKHALEADHYLAGSDQDRAADLMEAFLDPSVDVVLCSRGGYGCARLFPYLDLPAMAASGKLFLGYSDITSLHLALNRLGLVTAYAPVGVTWLTPREPWVYASFLSVLRGEDPIPPEAPRAETIVGGVAEGELTGGCLCLLGDSLGTPFSLEARGKIVLIEDVDEHPHRVDAMLTHLLNSGVLEGVAGFVIGEMTRTDEKTDATIGGRPWREIARERLEPLGAPMVFHFPFGHIAGLLTLPLGLRVRLDADAGRLSYLERLWS
jgi:muramoyltetrapeptide carboxypeptidase